VPVRCSWKSREKIQIHLRFVFVNGKKGIRETRGERERCVDLWEDRQLELSERGRERECIESFVDLCEDQQLKLRLEFVWGR
jgi:hypothetical protein